MSTIDAIALAVLQHRLAAVAEEMGVRLGCTGFSPNIKERRDYSCAVFDHRGRLVAQLGEPQPGGELAHAAGPQDHCVTGGEPAEGRVGLVEHRIGHRLAHDHADLRMSFSNCVGRFDPFHLVAWRHSDVGQNCVGAKTVDSLQELFRIAHARQHLNLPRVLEQTPRPLAHEVVVLGNDEAQSIRHRRFYPMGGVPAIASRCQVRSQSRPARQALRSDPPAPADRTD